MRKQIYLAIAILTLTIIFLSGCTQAPTGAVIKEEKQKLKVGVLSSQTGDFAYFGSTISKGLMLANKNNDVDIIIEDIAGSPKTAVTSANKLIYADKVDVLFTELSEDTEAVILIINKEHVPTICIACGSINITQKSEYLFRVWPSDEIEVKALVNYAKNKGYHRVAVLRTISVWENSLSQAFKDNWQGEILLEAANREDTDFRTQLLKIKEFKPEFIYLPFLETKYPQLLRQIKELGINAEIGVTSWINDQSILESCSSLCDEVIAPQYAPSSEAFLKEFRDAYKEEPGIIADVGYDAVKIVSSIKSRDKSGIVKELYNTDYEGATGKISFDSTRDRRDRKVDLFVINNMKLLPLK